MNRKKIPIFIMLVAGGITSIITYIKKYTIFDKLISLLIALIIFYILGCIFVFTLNYFERENAKIKLAEDEMIRKEHEEDAVEAEQGNEQSGEHS